MTDEAIKRELEIIAERLGRVESKLWWIQGILGSTAVANDHNDCAPADTAEMTVREVWTMCKAQEICDKRCPAWSKKKCELHVPYTWNLKRLQRTYSVCQPKKRTKSVRLLV